MLAEMDGLKGAVTTALFSPDSTAVLLSGSGGTMLWRWGTGKAPFVVSADGAETAAFSPDGRLVVTASWQYGVGIDTEARVWDTRKFAPPLLTLQGHFAPVVTVAFSPDGKLILTGGEDGVARLWDAATGKPLADLFGSEQKVRHVALGGDGRSIFVVSGEGAGRARRYACTVCGPAEELLTVAKERGAWRMPAAAGVAAK